MSSRKGPKHTAAAGIASKTDWLWGHHLAESGQTQVAIEPKLVQILLVPDISPTATRTESKTKHV